MHEPAYHTEYRTEKYLSTEWSTEDSPGVRQAVIETWSAGYGHRVFRSWRQREGRPCPDFLSPARLASAHLEQGVGGATRVGYVTTLIWNFTSGECRA
jgi:hypothetical protein